jgi:biopolymer transport protein ExbD
MRFDIDDEDVTPEVNLIPLIDVLLVMLIFLAATTSFAPQVALKVTLPKAGSTETVPTTTILAISQNGQYALGGELIAGGLQEEIAFALSNAIKAPAEATLVIYADAMTPHQFVVTAMQAARTAGIGRVNFATQGRD